MKSQRVYRGSVVDLLGSAASAPLWMNLTKLLSVRYATSQESNEKPNKKRQHAWLAKVEERSLVEASWYCASPGSKGRSRWLLYYTSWSELGDELADAVDISISYLATKNCTIQQSTRKSAIQRASGSKYYQHANVEALYGSTRSTKSKISMRKNDGLETRTDLSCPGL